jgi:glycosyltransferase involved in cell wall biosynthesis
MRILVLTYEYPPIGGGGGMAALEISRGLAQRGHEIHVLTASFHDLPPQEEKDGVQIFRLPTARRSAFKAGLLAMAGYVIGGSFGGLRHLHRWRPDLIHVHFAVPSGPVGWLLSRLNKIPYVLTAHLGDVPGGVPEKTARWFRWIYPFTPPIWKGASQVIAVSEFTRQLALKHYSVDIQVIPNAVDLNSLDPGLIQVNRPPTIVFAGRFMPQKNPLLLVHTLAELANLDWRCVMLGDGPLYPAVQEEVIRYGLQDRIRLPGWVNPEQVIKEFRQGDLLFMPSNSEGLPVVGVQALALGLAIVASRVGGFVDLVVGSKNGYLVEPGNGSEFKRHLEQLIRDPERLQQFRTYSRQKAREFDIDLVTTAYEKVFDKVLASNPVR